MLHRTKSLAVLCLTLSAACAAHRPAEVRAANDAAPGQGRLASRVTCHNEADTGSHLMRKVCDAPNAGDADLTAETQQVLRDVQQRSSQQPKAGN